MSTNKKLGGNEMDDKKVIVEEIDKWHRDYRAHCNACSHLAALYIKLETIAFRLCSHCAVKLYEQVGEKIGGVRWILSKDE